MADLPIPSTSPAPAARPAGNPARPAANPALRASSARAANPFQALLAQELGLQPEGEAVPGTGIAAAAAKPAAAADAGRAHDDDPALFAAAGDATLVPAYPGLIPFPPAIAAAPALTPIATRAAASPLAPAAVNTAPVSLALDPRQTQLAQAAVAASGASNASNMPTPAATAVAVPGKFPPAAAGASAQDSAAQTPVAPAAAELAAPGKLAPAAEGEFRREIAFDASVRERHKAEPTAGLHAGAAAPDRTAPAQAVPAPVAALDARVGQPGWDQGLGDKLVWMASQKHQVAELHLNPPELGPLKITLTLDQDQASAQFVSAHATVREAIESALPRLREMLADSGITLGNANVSTDAFREQAQHEPRGHRAPPAALAPDAGTVMRGERQLRQTQGLVDTFA